MRPPTVSEASRLLGSVAILVEICDDLAEVDLGHEGDHLAMLLRSECHEIRKIVLNVTRPPQY